MPFLPCGQLLAIALQIVLIQFEHTRTAPAATAIVRTRAQWLYRLGIGQDHGRATDFCFGDHAEDADVFKNDTIPDLDLPDTGRSKTAVLRFAFPVHVFQFMFPSLRFPVRGSHFMFPVPPFLHPGPNRCGASAMNRQPRRFGAFGAVPRPRLTAVNTQPFTGRNMQAVRLSFRGDVFLLTRV